MVVNQRPLLPKVSVKEGFNGAEANARFRAAQSRR